MNDDMLPREWCRGPQFASDAARAEWAPVIRSAQEAWATVELVSVSASLRPSALVFLTPEEMPIAARDAANVGLQVTPVQYAGGQYRVAVSQPGYARAWFAAWAESNDEVIGQLLGFPACCRAKFAEVWVAKRARDQAPYCRAFEGPWETNILLRHLGVRLVPHLPCSGDCSVSLTVARAFIEAGQKVGADMASVERLLRLPATYDAVNGVAIVDCGPFRFMHGTDNAPERLVLKRAEQLGFSDDYHSDTSCGKRMPANPDPNVHYDAGRQDLARPEDASAHDNGFTSRAAMDEAHAPIRQLFGPDRGQSLLDLGAGDGTLAESLSNKAVGVEVDPGRAERGRQRNPDVLMFTQDIAGFLRDLQRVQPFDVALLMPGRILELPEVDRPAVLEGLRRASRRVLVYAYGDWLTRFGGLEPLAKAAGLTLEGPVSVGANGAAAAAWAKEL